jgi:outer membrane protein
MRLALPFAALALVGQTLVAQTTPAALSLDEAVSIARRNNPLFQQVNNARRAADMNVRQAYANLLPSVSANASGRYQVAGQQFFNGIPLSSSSDIIQSSYSLGIGYQLDSRVILGPKVVKAQARAADAEVTGGAEALRAGITQQYLFVLQSQARAAVLDSLLQTTKGQLDLAKARNAVGSVSILDVRTAEVNYGRAEIAALQAKNVAEVQMLRLFEQMGVPMPTSNVMLTTKFQVNDVNFKLDSLKQLARVANPGLLALRSRESAQIANLRMTRGSYLPTLSFGTGWGWNASMFADGQTLVDRAQASRIAGLADCMSFDSLRVGAGLNSLNCTTSASFQPLTQAQQDAILAGNKLDFTKAPKSYSVFVSLPIFDNLGREGNVQRAQIDRENARFAVKGREVKLDADVTEAHLNLIAAMQTTRLQDINAQAAREALSFAEERYRVGAATFLDVTTARGNFEQAQIDRVNAVYEYHRAFAALENAVGRPLR